MVPLYEINWFTSRPYNNQTLPLLGETGNSSIINNLKYKVWVDSPRWTAKLRQTTLVHQKDWLYEKSWFIFGLLRYPKNQRDLKKKFFFIIWRQHKQTANEPEIPLYHFFEFQRLVLKLQCFGWFRFKCCHSVPAWHQKVMFIFDFQSVHGSLCELVRSGKLKQLT